MPRHRLLRAALGLTLLATLLSLAAPAWACSCVESNVQQAIARADVVFTGTVVAHSGPARTGPMVSSMDPITWKFRVEGVQKGEVALSQSVESASSSASCGYEFTPGERYRVMASWIEGDLQTGLCDGTHEAKRVVGRPPALDATEAAEPDVRAGDGVVGRAGLWSPTLLGLTAAGVLLLIGIGVALGMSRRRGSSATLDE